MKDGPSGTQGHKCVTATPMELSRDHKFPASVCSQSNKHGMGFGGFSLGDKGRVAGLSSWPGNIWDPPAGPSRSPFWNRQFSPLSSVDRRVGGRAASPSRRHHLLSAGHPAPLLGRTPGATQACLDLHVHRANVAHFVLSDPQLCLWPGPLFEAVGPQAQLCFG